MAIEKKSFGGCTAMVCNCKEFEDAKKLFNAKLIGAFLNYTNNKVSSLIFVSPATASIRGKVSNEIEEWLKSLPVPSNVLYSIYES